MLKVRWRNGEQPAPPPDETLTAFPFYSHFGTALAVSIGTLVLLSSTITAGPINAVRELAARVTGWCAAQHVHPYTEVSAAFDLLGSVWKHTLGAFIWIFERILHVNTELVDTKLLGGSLMAGVAVYIGWGIVSAKLDKPNEWRGNVKKLRGVIGVSQSHVFISPLTKKTMLTSSGTKPPGGEEVGSHLCLFLRCVRWP